MNDLFNVPITVIEEKLVASPIGNLEEQLKRESELQYLRIVRDIVDVSTEQLKDQNRGKKNLRLAFFIIFSVLIVLQLAFIITIVALQGSTAPFDVGIEIIVAVVSSVFVETLGAIILMIKYCFDSSQEVKVLEILNGVVKNFQKYNGNKIDDKKDDKKNQ